MNEGLKHDVVDLALEAEKLARTAEAEYTTEVEDILRRPCADPERIEHVLDGLLDFCFDPAVLVLFRRLCRRYFDLDPQAAAAYVHSYREMWDQ